MFRRMGRFAVFAFALLPVAAHSKSPDMKQFMREQAASTRIGELQSAKSPTRPHPASQPAARRPNIGKSNANSSMVNPPVRRSGPRIRQNVQAVQSVPNKNVPVAPSTTGEAGFDGSQVQIVPPEQFNAIDALIK